MQSDSIEGIYTTLNQCALISKSAGGIGLNVHNIRAKGSYIAGVSTFITSTHYTYMMHWSVVGAHCNQTLCSLHFYTH